MEKFKMFSKVIALTLIVSLLAGIIGGCAVNPTDTPTSASGAASTTEPAASETKSIALILSSPLGDKGFADLTYEGLQKAQKDFGVEVKVLEAKTPADIEPNLIAMIDAKYDLIICLGAQVKEILAKHVEDYPEQKFAIIDGRLDYPNVTSYIALQNEASFLAGAMAAMLTTKTDIEGINADKAIGWIGALETPVLRDFHIGFEQGAKYIDPEVKISTAFAGSFSDPLKGKELAFAQYSQGVDIIMHVAGPTGDGVFEAANEKKQYAIGVNTNQDGIYPGKIITSVIKDTGRTAYLLAKDLVEGTLDSSLDYMSLENGGVGLTDFATIKAAWGDAFPDDVLNKLEEIKADIISGKIVVESEPGYGRNAK